jgi:N-acyl-D-amino-acid deacylase
VDRGPKRRVFDLPGGHPRLTTAPLGVHGVWVNGVRIAGGEISSAERPGTLLRRFIF